MIHNTGRLLPQTENDPSFDGPTIVFSPNGSELAVSTRDELLIIETEAWTVARGEAIERMTRLAYLP